MSRYEGNRRPLSPAEVLAYELNQNKSRMDVSDGLTIVSRSLIEGACPPDELLRDAIAQVVKRHTLLNARIVCNPHESGGAPHFVADGSVRKSPSIEIIREGADTDSSNVSRPLDWQKYLNVKFDVENGDMMRVVVPSLGESSFELVTIMFHGICDAISVRALHYQIISRLATVVESMSISADPDCALVLKETPLTTSIPLPATHHAKNVLDKRVDKAAEPLPPPVPVPIVVTKTGAESRSTAAVSKGNAKIDESSSAPSSRSIAITSKFSTAETDALLAACRARNTTVHACIAAASLMAADCGESQKRVLTSAVDLRRRLHMKTDELVYAVGGFDGSAGFEYDLAESKSSDFWGLSQTIRSDLVNSIDSGRLLTTYLSSIEGLVGAYKAGYLDGGCFGTVFLSNIGNESYQKELGTFRWKDFNYIYGQFLPGGPHYHITCSTFEGQLTLNFQCVTPTISVGEAESFANATAKLMRDHIAPDPDRK